MPAEDAWEPPGEEGRDQLRKAVGRSQYPEIHGCPNGVTRRLRMAGIRARTHTARREHAGN